MTVEEKLQTEVITTEQAIYCLQHIEDVDGDKCDDCPYVDVCSEKGIMERIAQMAIKALEENARLKADKQEMANRDFQIAEEADALQKDLEHEKKRSFDILKEVQEYEIGLEKAREELQSLRGCSCSCSDGIIDDVEEILDKYLGEAKDDKSDRDK